MEILAIIPARGGSKGIKRKNVKLINGKPLVAYSIEAGLQSKYVTRTIVSTEDPEIKEIAAKFGAEVVDRPMELAEDETKTAPVVYHALKELEKTGYIPDYVVLLQPTCPLRDGEYIDSAFDFFFKHKNADSCFSGHTLGTTHAKWSRGKSGKLNPLYDFHKRPRRQDEAEHYEMIRENGAFYALSYKNFMFYKDFIGNNPCVYLSDFITDIDFEQDFHEVEKKLNENNWKNSNKTYQIL